MMPKTRHKVGDRDPTDRLLSALVYIDKTIDQAADIDVEWHTHEVVEMLQELRALLTTDTTALAEEADLVHNHGPREGRGLGCGERVIDGKLRGHCLDQEADRG